MWFFFLLKVREVKIHFLWRLFLVDCSGTSACWHACVCVFVAALAASNLLLYRFTYFLCNTSISLSSTNFIAPVDRNYFLRWKKKLPQKMDLPYLLSVFMLSFSIQFPSMVSMAGFINSSFEMCTNIANIATIAQSGCNCSYRWMSGWSIASGRIAWKKNQEHTQFLNALAVCIATLPISSCMFNSLMHILIAMFLQALFLNAKHMFQLLDQWITGLISRHHFHCICSPC